MYFVASVSIFWTQINICAKKAAVYGVLMLDYAIILFCHSLFLSSVWPLGSLMVHSTGWFFPGKAGYRRAMAPTTLLLDGYHL